MKSDHVYPASVAVAIVLYAIGLIFSGFVLFLATKIVKYAWFN